MDRVPRRDFLIAAPEHFPGGNVTGLSNLSAELVGRPLEQLKQVAPEVNRVAVLWHQGGTDGRTEKDMLKAAEVAARSASWPWRQSTGCRQRTLRGSMSMGQRSAGRIPANAPMTMALAMSIRNAPTTGTMMNACGA